MKQINKYNKYSVSVVLAAVLATTAIAQTPDSGSVLREVQPPKIDTPTPELPTLKSREYKAPISEHDSVKIYVDSFAISGNSAYSDEQLLAIVAPHANKELSLGEIKQIASLITRYYRDNGYFVARAYIPAQELDKESAQVEIAIIEGEYGQFQMDNSSNVNTPTVQSFMDRLTEGDVVSTHSLERQMLLINDLGGAVVTDAQIMPGKQVGTSDFIIEVSPQDRYSGYAMVDNYGSRYTGIHRLNVGAFVNSASNTGDVLALTGLISENGNLKNARVAYDRHLGYSGLKGGVSLSYTEYELGKELKNLEAKGQTTHFSTNLSYPLIKTRAHTLETRLSYDHKSLRDKTVATNSKKETNSLTLALIDTFNTAWFNRYGVLTSSVSLTSGELKLKSDDARANDVGLDAKGSYSKLNAEISQLQTITDSLYMTTSFNAQQSLNRNLDSSESFSVGGAYGVRAYKDSEQSGDKGYLASIELSYILPTYSGISHTLSTFVDHAKVWNNHDKPQGVTDNSRVLNGVGIGYSASYNDFSLNATLAHGFGPDREATADGGRADRNLLLVQGLWRF